MDKVQKSRNPEENIFQNIPNHDCPTSYNLGGRNTSQVPTSGPHFEEQYPSKNI
jgi:hypothetical protein